MGPFKSVKSTNSEFGEMDASLLELGVSGFSSEQSLWQNRFEDLVWQFFPGRSVEQILMLR